ncbi:MAG TPA: SGNH/GDSL hydrolase family protein [Polyangiaceae bacterium]
MNVAPRIDYRRARAMLARAARLLALASEIQAHGRRRSIDTSPLLARGMEVLAHLDPESAASPHLVFVRGLFSRHLDEKPVERAEVERYEAALRWARGWLKRSDARVRARASPAERAWELRHRLRLGSFRAAAVVLGVFLGAVCLELGLRVRAAASPPRDDLGRAALAVPPPVVDACDVQRHQAGLGEIVRPSRVHDVVYELKPNVDTCFVGARLTTNEDGQRAPVRYARPRPPGVYRILLLGDSIALGWGVEYEQTFAARVQEELAATSGRAVEVIDAAVPGYNTTMEVAGYLSTGKSYEAQCVAVFFCGNDLAVPHLMTAPSWRPVDGSYLLAGIRALGEPPGDDRWFKVAEGPLSSSLRDEDASWVPPEYRHMVGLTGYRHALGELARAAAANGATVVNFADYSTLKYVASAEEFTGFQRELGIVLPPFEYPLDEKYHLSSTDPHPNVEGHAEIARRVLAGLRATRACLPDAP